jgi:aminoglycoside 6'-N-acetyltransferase
VQTYISFRPLGRSDFPLLQEWLSAPHVEAWWHDRSDLASVEAKYGPRVDGAEPTRVFLMEYGRLPVGFIQWYLWSDYPKHAGQLNAELTSAGMDLAIGDFAMIGLGLGPVAIREFVTQIIFANLYVTAVVTDPEEGNVRSLSAFKKAEFIPTDKVQLVGENVTRQVMRMDRLRPRMLPTPRNRYG